MIEPPVFERMINWQRERRDFGHGEIDLEAWLLERLPYKVTLNNEDELIDLRDVDVFVQGKWSAYAAIDGTGDSHYFFEFETDALAFKLRWV